MSISPKLQTQNSLPCPRVNCVLEAPLLECFLCTNTFLVLGTQGTAPDRAFPDCLHLRPVTSLRPVLKVDFSKEVRHAGVLRKLITMWAPGLIFLG